MSVRRSERRPLPRARRGARRVCTRAGRIFIATRKNALVGRGLAPALRGRGAARRQREGLVSRADRGGADAPRARLAERPAARQHSCRSLPRQCLLHRGRGVGRHRFLFRLHRCARLRSRGLPQCLVLRARRLLQPDQGPGAAFRLSAAAGAHRSRDRGLAAAGSRRRLALPPDPPRRLAERAARRAR